jgi:D-arginine dehydrogenase
MDDGPMETHAAEAIIIGAGMAGATAAAHLAARRRVVLLEAEESAGYHATGRSAAIWIRNYGSADARILTAASRGFFDAPPPGFGAIIQARDVVHLAPPGQVAQLEAMLAAAPEMQPLDLAELRRRVPVLRPGYALRAALEPDCFDMDVAALHQGFLRQVAQRGGRLALRHRAGRVWRQAGLWHAEAATGAVFAAPILVNAAGAWADEVAALAGVALVGLQPKRRTACLIDTPDIDCASWPLLGDVEHSWYVRPEAGGRLMVSPADETDSPPLDARPEELDVAIAIDRMQQALDIPVRRIAYSWAGLRSFTPDRGLAIGPCAAPGFFWMAGQGGYGIQTAPAAGRLLAALVDGRAPERDVAAAVPLCDPRRFAG